MSLLYIDETTNKLVKLQRRTTMTGILGTIILLVFVAALLVSANLFITATLGILGVILVMISIFTKDTIDQELL